jgi:glycosyltransferase involved in cell wall biosynthesis
MRPLRILYIAYPLLPVSSASAGGAEQVLCTLEREMHTRGHRTTVAACEGSEVAGELISTGPPVAANDALESRERLHTALILQLIGERRNSGEPFDLIHDHSGLFWKHAGALRDPVLLTLHLPREFYGPELASAAPNVFLNCVSRDQQQRFAPLPQMLGVVSNGINLARFPLRRQKEDFLLWLGRICPEKGTHLAIAIARRVRRPLVIAGQVYPFTWHRQYFETQVAPHLGANIRFIESPPLDQKVRLLQRARALLLPSLIDETSSLVAMEAAACGTPSIAFRRGALPEVIEHGVTGFVADNAEQMRAALLRLKTISPELCRERAEARFSATRMGDDYDALYRAVLSQHAGQSCQAQVA